MRTYKEESLGFQFNPNGEGRCYICGKSYGKLPDILFYSTYKNLNAYINEVTSRHYKVRLKDNNSHFSGECCVACVQRFIGSYGTYTQMIEFWEEVNKLSVYHDFSKVLIPFGKKIYLKPEDND